MPGESRADDEACGFVGVFSCSGADRAREGGGMGAAAAAAAGGGESCRVAVVERLVCAMMDLDRSFGFRCLRFFFRAKGSNLFAVGDCGWWAA